MAESRKAKGSLPSFSTLDSPSVISKLINNDAIERPTGVTNDSLIIGDRQTGKTAVATDTILNQKRQGVICV